jgi:5'-3' exonuclease
MRIQRDWMVLSYMLGNDFLPCIPTVDISGLTEILETYGRVLTKRNTTKSTEVQYLVNADVRISWEFYAELIRELSGNEYASLRTKVTTYLNSQRSDDKIEGAVNKAIWIQKLKWNKYKFMLGQAYPQFGSGSMERV